MNWMIPVDFEFCGGGRQVKRHQTLTLCYVIRSVFQARLYRRSAFKLPPTCRQRTSTHHQLRNQFHLLASSFSTYQNSSLPWFILRFQNADGLSLKDTSLILESAHRIYIHSPYVFQTALFSLISPRWVPFNPRRYFSHSRSVNFGFPPEDRGAVWLKAALVLVAAIRSFTF